MGTPENACFLSGKASFNDHTQFLSASLEHLVSNTIGVTARKCKICNQEMRLINNKLGLEVY